MRRAGETAERSQMCRCALSREDWPALPPGAVADVVPMDTNETLTLPPPTQGEELFSIVGSYNGLGAPILGGGIERWLLTEGPQIETGAEGDLAGSCQQLRSRLGLQFPP